MSEAKNLQRKKTPSLIIKNCVQLKTTVKKHVIILKFISNWTNLPLSQKTGASQQNLQPVITATYSQIFPQKVKNQLDAMVSR